MLMDLCVLKLGQANRFVTLKNIEILLCLMFVIFPKFLSKMNNSI